MTKKWTHIMLHHSLTKDSQTLSWDDIRRYHTETNHWADIGYHAGIEEIEKDFEILIGRPWTMTGAHCYQNNMNHQAFGFMFCGNFDLDAPPRQMIIKACKYIIKPVMDIYDVPVDRIVGHGQYAPKSCPGERFDMGTFFDILSHT